jgi:prevent-host-death family protein
VIEVNIHDAKTQLSRLIAKVEEGEEVIIARAGKPVAKLVRADRSKQSRKLGDTRGKSGSPMTLMRLSTRKRSSRKAADGRQPSLHGAVARVRIAVLQTGPTP